MGFGVEQVDTQCLNGDPAYVHGEVLPCEGFEGYWIHISSSRISGKSRSITACENFYVYGDLR